MVERQPREHGMEKSKLEEERRKTTRKGTGEGGLQDGPGGYKGEEQARRRSKRREEI